MALPINGKFGMNGTTKNLFVVDTNAVIALIDGRLVSPGMQKPFDEAGLYISVITEMELYAKRSMTPAEEIITQAFIADSVSVVDINSAIKKQTIALRRSTKIKLPDCIIAATSIVLNAVLLTNDDKLLKLSFPGYRAQNL
jgi:predicted nucleic acid-binding protein